MAGPARHRLPVLAAGPAARPARRAAGQAVRGLELRRLPGRRRAGPDHAVRGHHPDPGHRRAAGARPARLRAVFGARGARPAHRLACPARQHRRARGRPRRRCGAGRPSRRPPAGALPPGRADRQEPSRERPAWPQPAEWPPSPEWHTGPQAAHAPTGPQAADWPGGPQAADRPAGPQPAQRPGPGEPAGGAWR